MAKLAEHQHNRNLHSIATNPNYFNPPFASIAFTPAAHHFVFALMANHTEERPLGILLPSDLLSSSGASIVIILEERKKKLIFSFYCSCKYAADEKTLIYTPGVSLICYTAFLIPMTDFLEQYEKIPDDWYKRAFNDDIVIAVTQQCAAYPQTCQIGGNQGAVNTYAGIDPSDISGGELLIICY